MYTILIDATKNLNYDDNLQVNTYLEILRGIHKIIKEEDIIYIVGDPRVKLQNFMDRLAELLYAYNKKENIDKVLYKKIMSQISNLYLTDIYTANKLGKFKQQNIIFEGKNIGDIIEKYISVKIRDINPDINDINQMIHSLLIISTLFMDNYALIKIIKNIEKQSQFSIVYAGNAHIKNYIDFFKNVLKINPLPNATEIDIFEISAMRCVKNLQFGKIFGKWIDLSLFPQLTHPGEEEVGGAGGGKIKNENPDIHILGPKKIYEYNSNDRINSGNFGDVYLGRDRKTNKEVAIKMIKGDDKVQKKSIYDNEVKCLKEILGYCDTYGLICLQDAFEEYDKYYIVTPYLREFSTLRNFIETNANRYTKLFSNKIKYRLGYIVGEIHKKNMVHGDLSVDNIMIKNGEFKLDKDYQIDDIDPFEIKLIDFGLCKDQATQENKKEEIKKFMEIIKILREHSSSEEIKEVDIPVTKYL
jgi:tRNA A-37 threonylcarbamoyl transferase component Bud32